MSEPNNNEPVLNIRRKSEPSPEQKDIQKARVKIANLVARNKEIDKTCCICGKPGRILHNPENPYFISFICRDCKTLPENVQVAIDKRFDIRAKLDKNNLNVRNFTNEDIIKIIKEYDGSQLSIGHYCEKIGISSHQFVRCQKIYVELTGDTQAILNIKNHSKAVQKHLIRSVKDKITK